MKHRNPERGIALFMVISAITVLSILVTELTFSTQIAARMAYNAVDNLKAYYLVKAGYRLALLRLNAYRQIQKFLDDPNKAAMAKGMLDKAFIEQIWAMPLVYPPPIPKEATVSETDKVKDFLKDSKLQGSYSITIKSESAKLNLNNLLVKEPIDEKSGAQAPGQKKEEIDFKPIVQQILDRLVEEKKKNDREFADIYRNLSGKDILDAILAYMTSEVATSSLPGFQPMKPKNAPLYSLTELHYVSGIDDEIYNMIASSFTVYSTPGINVNTLPRPLFKALFSELSDDDLALVFTKRDAGMDSKLWNDEKEFWDELATTSAAKSIPDLQNRFKKYGIKILTSEQSFKIDITAAVGLSTRRLEAYVVIDPSLNQTAGGQQGQAATPPGVRIPVGTDTASSKKDLALKLIYWRMI